MEHHPGRATNNCVANFFNVLKGITVHGYYTSEIGFSQELNFKSRRSPWLRAFGRQKKHREIHGKQYL